MLAPGSAPETIACDTVLVAIGRHPERVPAVEAIRAACAEFDVREMYAEPGTDDEAEGRKPASILEADARIRTGDPIITSDVLYQLSYVGGRGRSRTGV